jgi:hypothetical protein
VIQLLGREVRMALVEVQWTRDLQHWTSESMERTVSVTTGAERYEPGTGWAMGLRGDAPIESKW